MVALAFTERKAERITMPDQTNEIKLSPLEIKIKLMERGVSAAELARRWSIKLKRKVWPENVRRVINCTEGFAQPELRRQLAKFLSVPVSAIGREAARKPKKKAA
jgi:hypothetical protein